MLRYGLAMLLLLSSAWAEASATPARTQKVTYPDGRVVYEAVEEKPADKSAAGEEASAKPEQLAQADTTAKEPAPEKTPTPADASPVVVLQSPGTSDPKLPCGNCGDGTTPPTGPCQLYNPPLIISSGGAGCDHPHKPTDNPNPQVGHIDSEPGTTTHFYAKCTGTFTANALIPKIVKNQREVMLFGRAQYGDPCCKYEVCVVTQCQCIETQKCELRPKVVNMRACRRTDGGTIDVYVLGEPGFPAQWVLYLGLTPAAYQAKFPGSPLP